MANTELATAWIQLQPSFEGVQSKIQKELSGGRGVEAAGLKTGQRFTTGASRGLKTLGVAVGAAFAAKKVADFFADSLDAVKNWQVLNSQTAAAVKSTGGAANVTAQQVHALAETLEGMTATQAESIQEGANMLLTFKNIRNELGDGNNIFDRATTSLVDMTRAMGTDPQTAAIQLGKALNDPVQGISALSRVGIQFTDDQKALIKSLVEVGDTAGAQKIILEELESQFGGSGESYADTYAGKLFLLQDAFGDVGEEIVTKLMPHFETMIDWLRDDGMKVVEDFIGLVEDTTVALDDLSKQEWFAKANEELGSGGSLDLATGGFVENFKKKWQALPQSFANGWEQIKAGNVVATAEIGSQFEQSWNDWGGKFENGRRQINAGVTSMWEEITGKFANGWSQISFWWNDGWDGLGMKLENGRRQINVGVSYMWEEMTGKFANGWSQISKPWANGWAQLTTMFDTASSKIKGIATRVASTFERVANDIRDAFRGIGKFISDAFGPIGDFLGGAGNQIRNFFSGTGDAARHVKGKLQSAQVGGAGGGGPALARVRSTLPAGLSVTDTLSSPARDAMLGLQRSANSFHYDASNPAVDIAGPIPLLWEYARKLQAMGGWRQFLWQVPGHYDHIHVAHTGGVVSPSWFRSPGDRADERTVRLQVGETVLPRNWSGDTDVDARGASSSMVIQVLPERGKSAWQQGYDAIRGAKAASPFN